MKHAKHAAGPKASTVSGRHAANRGAVAPSRRLREDDLPTFEDVEDEDDSRKGGALKVVGIILGILVALALVAYLAGAFVFQKRFYPNTLVGGEDVSMMSAEEAAGLLSGKTEGYALLIEGGDFSYRLMPADVSFAFDAEGVVSDMLGSRSTWLWPLEAFATHDKSDFMYASFDDSQLTALLGGLIEAHNAEANPPVDAHIAYDASLGQFSIVPDEYGDTLNCDAVLESTRTALSSLTTVLELTESHRVPPVVLRDDERLVNAAAAANAMLLVDTTFLMGDSVAANLNADVVSSWISIDADYAVSLNEEAMSQWAYAKASEMSTYTSGRTYTRADGKEITVSGGSYGWVVDADSFYSLVKSAVENDQSGEVAVPVTREAATYHADGGRDWGNSYVDVDLSEQHARFYDDDGDLVWESDIVSGVPGYNTGSITPTGVFTLTANPTPATLRGTDWDGSKYESKVRYWMPFDGYMIGLHDADWQWAFGGNRYQIGYGSHGCVNLPVDKAGELAQLIVYGDVVVVHW